MMLMKKMLMMMLMKKMLMMMLMMMLTRGDDACDANDDNAHEEENAPHNLQYYSKQDIFVNVYLTHRLLYKFLKVLHTKVTQNFLQSSTKNV
jgi:hypothetical protein